MGQTMTSAGIIQRNRRFIFSIAIVALAAGISGCTTTDKTTTGSIAPAAGTKDTFPAGNFDQMNDQQRSGPRGHAQPGHRLSKGS
jgi:hypothetical protein